MYHSRYLLVACRSVSKHGDCPVRLSHFNVSVLLALYFFTSSLGSHVTEVVWVMLPCHFFLLLLLLVILFIYISNVILLPSFPSTSPLSLPPSPCLYEGAPNPPTCLSGLEFPYPESSSLHCSVLCGLSYTYKRNQIYVKKLKTGSFY